MTGQAEISVVMGVYNGASLVRETVESILHQEGVTLELIAIDDGSTDESGNILEQYAARDPRVRVIHQENQGLTRALIRGCAEARASYIARQDVGDSSHPRRLRLQKEALDADRELAFVSCWTDFCGPEWEFLYCVKGTGRASLPTSIISESEEHGVIDGPACHASVMFRTESYKRAGGYRAEFRCGQDWDLWYRLAEVGKFQMIEQPLHKARLVPDSISSYNKQEQAAAGNLSLEAMLLRRRGASDDEVLDRARRIPRSRSHQHASKAQAAWLYFIGECLRRNDDNRALDYFLKSIRAYPFIIKSWIKMLEMSIRPRRLMATAFHRSAATDPREEEFS